jgi:hypothetical protein
MGTPSAAVPELEEVEEPSINCSYSYHGAPTPSIACLIKCLEGGKLTGSRKR